jgi:hypothetical protein
MLSRQNRDAQVAGTQQKIRSLLTASRWAVRFKPGLSTGDAGRLRCVTGREWGHFFQDS